MREYLATLLNSDTVPTVGLRARGLPADAVYSAENVDTPPQAGVAPFIVMRLTDNSVQFRGAPSQPQNVDIWCYDRKGDFRRIDGMLRRIRDLLESLQGVATPVGWITQIDWLRNGPDGYDDVWESIVRTASYRVVGSIISG